jgi:PII-like signaling protein
LIFAFCVKHHPERFLAASDRQSGAGVSVNMPLIIEVVDEESKLEPLLPELKHIIGDDGLVSISYVYVL